MHYIFYVYTHLDGAWQVQQKGPSLVTEPSLLTAMSRKFIQEGFWNDELHKELLDTGMPFTFYKPEDRERCMVQFGEMRLKGTYDHKCYTGCKERGLCTTTLQCTCFILYC